MYYFEDLKAVDRTKESNLIEFVFGVIAAYKASDMYNDAVTAYEYFKRRNVTISKYQKILHDLNGGTIPDPYSSNHKFCNAFFTKFVKQENAFLLGNGVTFNEDGTKEALGGDDFDGWIYTAGEYALWGGVSYIFYNRDHLNIFKATDYAPLIGEEDGALHAGVRFWQIDSTKPLRATLYEEDGFTEFIWKKNEKNIVVGSTLKPKQPYKQVVRQSVADGVEILEGNNYPNFPIVPLWANKEHQSELVGLRAKIDGYDLIQSGFANDLDDASQIYWIVQNAGGMDDIDLTQFLDRLRRVHAAIVEDDGAKAEAHTLEIPYAAREAGLASLRDSLYADAMALDTEKMQAGNITATAINAAYENLELKCDGFEYCVTQAIKALLALAGLDDAPIYHRRKTTNQPEVTTMVLAAAEYLDDETVLNHLPFLSIDEVDEILMRKDEEEAARFAEEESGGAGDLMQGVLDELDGLLADLGGEGE